MTVTVTPPTTKTYAAVARRVGNWWAVDVPGVKGVHTQARRLAQVEPMVRDALAAVLGVPEETLEISIEYHVDEETQRAIAEARHARDAAREAFDRAADATERAVSVLKAHGYSVRDAGHLVGVSFQRVSQLVSKAAHRSERHSDERHAKAHR